MIARDAAYAPALPIDDALPELQRKLGAVNRCLLMAPPGAGKTTRVPHALMGEAWLAGRRIVMVEPRRLAARAAARRLAASLGEPLGRSIGLRARTMTATSPEARIEVVTEGVFTRMILDDPELAEIGLVIFDEFHERSLDADFGLALSLDAQTGLRDDLRILVMSATLDGTRLAEMLVPCSIVESRGRSFGVETHFLGRDPHQALEDQVVPAVRRALRTSNGSVLVFLPGGREILRAAERLRSEIDDREVSILPLYGGLDRSAQDTALAPPAPGRRNIIIATDIAETSLTIEGVSAVVDAGFAREPRYDVGARLTRLVTVRISRASAEQRRGRAGRLGPGHCYRLWSEPETQSLPANATPEILSSDLTGLVLDCAHWGVTDPAQLTWLDPPPAAAVEAAVLDLRALGALDEARHLTPFGTAVRNLPLAPHLAAMICRAVGWRAETEAALLAALLSERGLGGDGWDIAWRLERLRSDQSARACAMRAMAARWAVMAANAMKALAGDQRARRTAKSEPLSPGAILALGYPDRIAKWRGRDTDYVTAGGRGAHLGDAGAAQPERYLVIADMQGQARSARIQAAAAISEAEIDALFGDRIETTTETSFDDTGRSVRAKRRRRLGALVLTDEAATLDNDRAVAEALTAGIKRLGIGVLPFSKAQHQLRDRVAFLRAAEPDAWPDLSDDALAAGIENWLGPYLAGKSAISDISIADIGNGLDLLLDWSQRRHLDELAPTHFEAPTGQRHPISYDGEQAPSVSLRVQELFGLARHPTIADGRLALTLILLSPAGRPIQVTRDLPGFWAGSWADVRADLRGRYPKHPWPEHPLEAQATRRAKPRKR